MTSPVFFPEDNEQKETACSNPNVSFKLAISKTKIEKLHQQNIENLITETQIQLNRKRAVFLFLTYLLCLAFINCIVFGILEKYTVYISLTLCVSLTVLFLVLISRNAPMNNDLDIIKKL